MTILPLDLISPPRELARKCEFCGGLQRWKAGILDQSLMTALPCDVWSCSACQCTSWEPRADHPAWIAVTEKL